jgi:signal transduction histidine kinase
MSARTATVEELRPVDLFDDLDDDALAEFAAIAEVRDLEPGDVVADHAASPAGMVCLLDGTLANHLCIEGRFEPAGRQHAPTWSAAISVLTEGPLGVRMSADSPARVALLEAAAFRRLVLSHPPVHRRIMLQVQPVMTRITGWEADRDRLASLGTMAAGLAHELNNPAAAARRAAADMAAALDVLADTVGRFVESGMERDGAAALVALQREALERARGRTALDALDAADAEDELLEALEDAGISDAWSLAEPLSTAGLDAGWIGRLAATAGPATRDALEWVATSLTARGLAAELIDSAERMSRLVGAVKTYAYMDRGGTVTVDVHEGLETTLVVLAHKIKHTAIDVVRDYDRELPPLSVHGSELNQVWTNLLDNAIDALGESGTITIATRRDGGGVRVDVTDDGPGIPRDVVDHVFDPFFTTKGVGAGTGLGLDTARRIIVDRHDGTIGVESAPGATTFHVWLPIKE